MRTIATALIGLFSVNAFTAPVQWVLPEVDTGNAYEQDYSFDGVPVEFLPGGFFGDVTDGSMDPASGILIAEYSRVLPLPPNYSAGITGSFVFDADIGTYSNIDLRIVTKSGNVIQFDDQNLSCYQYNRDYRCSDAAMLGVNKRQDGLQYNIRLFFDAALTNAGGTLGLKPYDELDPENFSRFVGCGAYCGYPDLYAYSDTPIIMLDTPGIVGTAVVPLPATAWLLFGALSAAGITSRKRSRAYA